MNRRQFIQASTGAAFFSGTSATLYALAKDDVYRNNIGLQLYTLRDQLKQDASGTMKVMAEAGYKQAELFGFPNCDDLVRAAHDHGLAIHSSHFEWESAVNPSDQGFSDFKKIIEKAKDLRLGHLVVPYLHDKDRRSINGYKRIAENLNKAASLAKEAGIQLSYHNHSFEFAPLEGSSGYEVFMKEFDSEMKFEIDVFWVQAAQMNPVELIQKLKGRVSQLHLKDLKQGLQLPIYGGMPKEGFKELGKGCIAMEPIIEAGRAAGVIHCHVEQDQSPNPLASIKESISYLKSL